MPEKGRYAWFTRDEYERRQNKASRLMAERGIDALFILQSENLSYFTGYISWLKSSKHRPFVGILPQGKAPVLALPRLQLGDAEGFSYVEDIRLWSANYLDFFINTLKDMGLSNKRIGVEIGHDTHLAMSLLEFEQLKAMLPDVTWVDATDLIFDVRKIKSEPEIAYLRRVFGDRRQGCRECLA
jgi:Xaa-Pro aminopeptidase